MPLNASAALVAPSLLQEGPHISNTVRCIAGIVAHSKLPMTIDCPDREMASALAKIGLVHDQSSKIAWASTLTQFQEFSKLNKLVVCAHPEWLSMGAGFAITEKDGRLSVEINMPVIQKNGIDLGHILKSDPIPPKPIG